MRDLNISEIDQVNGGVAPLVAWVVGVAAVDLGLIAAMYVVSLVKK